MHLHSVTVSLEADPAASDVRHRFAAEPRLEGITTASGCDSCTEIREYAQETGRPRWDVWENCIWADAIDVSDGRLTFFQVIHTTSSLKTSMPCAPSRAPRTPVRVERRDEAIGVGM